MKKFIASDQPLVSVIMTAFCAAPFIDEAITSILNQTYTNFELLIVDDGSTDETWKHIKLLSKGDKRIKAFRLTKNLGPSGASNFAIAKAHGTYIARMDADDIATADRIEKQVAYLKTHPKVILIGGQCDLIDENGEYIGKKRFPESHDKIVESLFMINPIQHPTWMFRKSVFDKAGITYEREYLVSHDLKILFRLLGHGTFANIPDTILQYRFRPNSITHKNPKRSFGETISVRHWALAMGYRPTLKALGIHGLELALVSILPAAIINKLFTLWRIKSTKTTKALVEYQYNLAYEQP